MRSTSTSEKEILRVERLNLVFQVMPHPFWSWRDAFTQAVRNPLEVLLAEPDRLHILKDVSFTLRQGDRVGLLGVNGTGKTSLCRCIAGIYAPTSGSVVMNGRLRAIFDTAVGIQPELTGIENARLLAELIYPESDYDRERLVSEATEFSELGKFLDVPYRLYSNGMQARLCLSLISSRPCDLLILDEVFDGADAFFREKISARILKMITASGAVLFVSHGADQIRRVCNRLIVLADGHVVHDGDVESGLALYERSGARKDFSF
jgi:ABC-type polysaccharide/polyol phosphate transport system ATPase subunit